MNLISVFGNQKGYAEVRESLEARFKVKSLYEIDRKTLFDEFESIPGYAHCMYHGKIKEGVELTELELAMICDRGHSFFGGYSHIYKNRTFAVKIYTD